jgi:hypothetical protein
MPVVFGLKSVRALKVVGCFTALVRAMGIRVLARTPTKPILHSMCKSIVPIACVLHLPREKRRFLEPASTLCSNKKNRFSSTTHLLLHLWSPQHMDVRI